MSEPWNNIEGLRTLSQGLMWAAGLFAVTAALVTGARYYVDRRIGELAAQARLAEAEAKEKDQAEREAALRAQLQGAERELQNSTGKLANLEARARPRLLTDDQRRSLIDRLKNCPLKVVSWTAPLGDPEALAFAKYLESAFVEAGWQTQGVSQAVFTGVPVGVLLRVPSREDLHPCAVQVQQAFGAIGIQAPGDLVPGSPTDRLDIVVGHKP